MSLTQNKSVLATSAVQPSLLQQVGMAGGAAVITVTFIHPIDVVKVNAIFHTLFHCAGEFRISMVVPWIEIF